jgi:hypothetical protein
VGVLNLEEWLYLKLPCLESIFPGNERTALLFFLFLGGTLLLIYLGFVVNANDTSLHYLQRSSVRSLSENNRKGFFSRYIICRKEQPAAGNDEES